MRATAHGGAALLISIKHHHAGAHREGGRVRLLLPDLELGLAVTALRALDSLVAQLIPLLRLAPPGAEPRQAGRQAGEHSARPACGAGQRWLPLTVACLLTCGPVLAMGVLGGVAPTSTVGTGSRCVDTLVTMYFSTTCMHGHHGQPASQPASQSARPVELGRAWYLVVVLALTVVSFSTDTVTLPSAEPAASV